MAKRFVFAMALLMVTISFSSCPPTFNIMLGDWVIQFSTFPLGSTNGLTLNADGTATPFQSYPGGGVYTGNWTWESNGRNVTFRQFNAASQVILSGQLQSDTTATGVVRSAETSGNFGDWDAVHTP